MRYRVLSLTTIAVWAVLIVLIGLGVAVWLLVAYTAGDSETNQLQLNAIRTAGTIAIGFGGVAALLLAARRQRSTEIALKQKDRDQVDADRAHVLQERIADATAADAEARRITDLYTKAADQLGSDKAPVRLAGLYALERLAQDNPTQRQTIVNLWCAYLRMPYNPPTSSAPVDSDDQVLTQYREQVQERQVRLTTQRLLVAHSSLGLDGDDQIPTLWLDIDLDLSGATLFDLDMSDCVLRSANFESATFLGPTDFGSTTFKGDANFFSARFEGGAYFSEARFRGAAYFDDTTFTTRTYFSEVKFDRQPYFHHTTFGKDVPKDIMSYWVPPRDMSTDPDISEADTGPTNDA